MVTLDKVHPLTAFRKDPKSHLRRMNKTGQPEVLTVKGKPAVVVQDARSYQKLLDALDEAEAIAGIKRGLDGVARGEGQDVNTAFAQLRRKYRIPPPK